MNDREKAFLRRLSEQRLTPNQYRMLLGLLGGCTIRQVGLPETSRERTVTELRKLGYLEKIDGRWRLAGDVAGIFELQPAVAGRSQTIDPPPVASPAPAGPSNQYQSAPAAGDATVVRGWRHQFFARPGDQVVRIVALLELTGTSHDACKRITDLALSGQPTPADLVADLDRAESLAQQRFPA